MPSKRLPDVLVLGAGPAGMAIASALGKEKLEDPRRLFLDI